MNKNNPETAYLIKFVGTLISTPSEVPRCGDQAFAVTYKYRREKIVSGENIKNKIVLVTIPCPDLKGQDFFKLNTSYLITAESGFEKSRQYTVINDYGNKYLRLWCLDIEQNG